MQGKVKWFSSIKGYGFIEILDREGQCAFVHHSSIQDTTTLLDGQLVEFDLYESKKGLEAKNIKIC